MFDSDNIVFGKRNFDKVKSLINPLFSSLELESFSKLSEEEISSLERYVGFSISLKVRVSGCDPEDDLSEYSEYADFLDEDRFELKRAPSKKDINLIGLRDYIDSLTEVEKSLVLRFLK